MQIAQIRYYNDNDERNSPYKLYTELCGDTAFKNFGTIKKLGIQTLPGTRVYFNKSITPIIIGATGIYELDLSDKNTFEFNVVNFENPNDEFSKININKVKVLEYNIVEKEEQK